MEIKDANELASGKNLRESLILLLKAGIEEMNKLANDKRGLEDPDIVHDLRVSARRLQTVLESIGAILPAGILRKSKAKIKDIIKTLGKARENDVSIGLINRLLKNSKKEDGRDTIKLIFARLKNETNKERERAVSNSNVYNDIKYFNNEFLMVITSLEIKSFKVLTSLRISKDLKSNGLLILPRQFDRMIKLVRVVAINNSEELHKIRIKAKPVRYTMEFFRFVYGDDFAELTKEMKKFVEILGDIHDRDVLIEQLRDYMDEIRIYNSLNKKGNLSTGLIKKFIKTLENERKMMFIKIETTLSEWLKGNFRERLILAMSN